MNYINPFALFQFDIQDPSGLDKALLKRTKRKILAEFELSDDIVIKYQGHSLDKATALKILEELEDETKRNHYWYLHCEPNLQKFLLEGKLRFLRKIPKAAELGDPSFREFLSKELAPIFDRHLSKHLKKGHQPEVSLLIQRFDLIIDRDMDLATKGSLRFLNQNIQVIKSATLLTNQELEQFNQTELFDLHLIHLINRFPPLYQHIRNRYADALYELSINLHNQVDRTFIAYNMICSAAELHTDLVTREKVNNIKVQLWQRQKEKKEQQSYSHSYSGSNEQTSSSRENPFVPPKAKEKSWSWLWIPGLLFFIAIIALNGRRSQEPHIDFSNKIYTPTIPDISSFEIPDLVQIDEFASNFNNSGEKSFQALLDSIDKGLEASENTSLDPAKTGDQPYKKILEPVLSKTGEPLAITNLSDLDMICFIENYTKGTYENHVFIRKGGTFVFKNLPPGFKRFRAYSGLKFSKKKVSYLGESLSGFSKKVQSIKDQKNSTPSQLFYLNLNSPSQNNSKQTSRIGFTFRDQKFIKTTP